MNNLVECVLKNDRAFTALSSGGHPAAFLSANKISFSEHFKLVGDSAEYALAFYRAVTASLAVWHTVADRAVLGFTPQSSKGYHTSIMPYKFDTKLWQERVKDVERYIPDMKLLEDVVREDHRVSEININIAEPVDIRKLDAND